MSSCGSAPGARQMLRESAFKSGSPGCCGARSRDFGAIGRRPPRCGARCQRGGRSARWAH
eukprot:3337516-Pyramimonas_sp.AAC.1